MNNGVVADELTKYIRSNKDRITKLEDDKDVKSREVDKKLATMDKSISDEVARVVSLIPKPKDGRDGIGLSAFEIEARLDKAVDATAKEYKGISDSTIKTVTDFSDKTTKELEVYTESVEELKSTSTQLSKDITKVNTKAVDLDKATNSRVDSTNLEVVKVSKAISGIDTKVDKVSAKVDKELPIIEKSIQTLAKTVANDIGLTKAEIAKVSKDVGTKITTLKSKVTKDLKTMSTKLSKFKECECKPAEVMGKTVTNVESKDTYYLVTYSDGTTKKIDGISIGGPAAMYSQPIGIGGGGSSTEPVASGVYTNLESVPTTLGGVVAGTTFDEVPIVDIITMLLYPYQYPSFTSFSIATVNALYEVGDTIVAGLYDFNWSTSNDPSILPNTIKIDDVTGGYNIVTTTANDYTENLSIVSDITNTVATSHLWKITGTNDKGSTFSKNLTVKWQWRIYYGESPLTTLTETDVEALRVNTLSASSAQTYAMLGGDYKWICYPTSMGLKTSFKDIATNFDVAMNPVETVNLTNTFGVSEDYYCHRTYNILGSGISIAVS